MDGWQTQHDLSWMSFTHQARNRARGGSVSERIDTTSRRSDWIDTGSRSERRSWNTSDSSSSTKRRSKSFGGGFEQPYGWVEPEILMEEDEEEELTDEEDKLFRNRRRGKEHMRKVSEDFDETDSTTSESMFDESAGRPPPYSFSPMHLGAGFQKRRKDWISRFEKKLIVKLPESKFYRRLQYAAAVTFCVSVVALFITSFLLYLSLGASVQPPSACESDKIVLNFSAQRIRLRGGRYISFREHGVSADRAEHAVVVVHDLLSSRLASIPGINDSLLEEFKVRLVSYDRPGYGQSDPHRGRNYNTSAWDIADIADTLGLGEKFWVMGFGGGGPHVWAAINYIPERLAGVALFAPAGNPYVNNMTNEEIDETWGVLTLRQKWMYSIARHFPALLPSLLQKTSISNSPYVPTNVRLSLGAKDQAWMEQPHIMGAWKDDVREALQQGCAFPMAEELMMLVNDWGFSLAELPFKEHGRKTIFHHMINLFAGKEKPRIFTGPIHIWQGTDDRLVPMAINNFAKRMVDQNDVPRKTVSPVKLHYLEGEGHFSWFWFCDDCHRRIFEALFRPKEAAPVPPVSPSGLSVDEYEAIVTSFGSPKDTGATSKVKQANDKPTDPQQRINVDDGHHKQVVGNFAGTRDMHELKEKVRGFCEEVIGKLPVNNNDQEERKKILEACEKAAGNLYEEAVAKLAATTDSQQSPKQASEFCNDTVDKSAVMKDIQEEAIVCKAKEAQDDQQGDPRSKIGPEDNLTTKDSLDDTRTVSQHE